MRAMADYIVETQGLSRHYNECQPPSITKAIALSLTVLPGEFGLQGAPRGRRWRAYTRVSRRQGAPLHLDDGSPLPVSLRGWPTTPVQCIWPL